jgi:hypothetical protein
MNVKTMASVLLVAGALAGCASSADSGPTAESLQLSEPEVLIAQLSNVGEAARHMSGGIPVQFRVQVTNPAATEIRLERIDLVSIGAGAYDLPNASHPVNIVVAPQATQSVDFWAPANISDVTVYGANGPVSIRVTSYFNSAKGKFTHTTVEQVHTNFSGR